MPHPIDSPSRDTSLDRRAAKMASAGGDQTPTQWRTEAPESPVERLRGPEEPSAPAPVRCGLCPHDCLIPPDASGTCGARANKGGVVVSLNYGQATSLALDPVEKKPLRNFHPGSTVLSYGSWGCNLSCPFCQNHEISLDYGAAREGSMYLSPSDLADKAKQLEDSRCIGVAFTYNEPTISYEYVLDACRIAHDQGLLTVLVTNGYLNEPQWTRLMKVADAVNIDLKSFSQKYYTFLGAPKGLEVVKRSIEIANELTHVEISTLVVPPPDDALVSQAAHGELDISGKSRSAQRRGVLLPGNDTVEEIDELSRWINSIDPQIPLHLLGFRPKWHLTNRPPTSYGKLAELAEVARRNLIYVYGD